MVSSKKLMAAALVASAGLAFVSCEGMEEWLDNNKDSLTSEVTIAANASQFDENGKATLTLTVNPACVSQIVAVVAVGEEAENGYEAVDPSALGFEGEVTIAANATSATIEVTVDLDAAAGKEAVFTIASVDPSALVKIGEAKTAYVKVPAKPAKLDLSGAQVWSIIGSFNDWAADIDLAKISDSPEAWEVKGAEFGGEFKFRGNHAWGNDFDLGSSNAVVLGDTLYLAHKGANINIDNGTYDVVLYPESLIAVITAAAVEPDNILSWNVSYDGCDWLEGDLSYGQLEAFTVSDTDTEKYYYPFVVDLSEDDDMAALLASEDAPAFFASLQKSIDEVLEYYMDYYEATREELVPELFYNEENDGTTLYNEGLAAGNYQFAVLSLNELGILDGCYKVISFSKAEDAISIYPWFESYNKREDWGAEWDGWYTGYEGKYYWFVGQAPGAAYITCDTYTDDELVYYYDGNMVDMYNYTASGIADYVYAGYDMETLAYYYVVTALDEDGIFEDYTSTWGLTGETNLYIIAFDADGNILQDYGVSVIDIPEYVEVPIDWAEQSDWAVNYDATVETGYEDYPQAVVVTACTAKYFDVSIYDEGTIENYGIEAVADDLGDWSSYMGTYTMDDLVGYGAVGTCDDLPFVTPCRDLKNGLDIIILAYDENGKFTGEWYSEPLAGLEEEAPAELTLVEDWSIELDGDPFVYGNYTYCYVTVNAPDIQYFWIEENTDEDLDYYYGGSVSNLLSDYEADFMSELAKGSEMSDLAFTIDDGYAYFLVWNFGDTYLYLMEFDENGASTGRYAKCAVNIPEIASDEISAMKNVRFIVRDSAKVRKNTIKSLKANMKPANLQAKAARHTKVLNTNRPSVSRKSNVALKSDAKRVKKLPMNVK